MITIYTKNNCMQCKMSKKWLTEHNVPFTEINIEEHPEFVSHIKDDLGFSAAPVVEKENGDAFYGFNINELRLLQNQ